MYALRCDKRGWSLLSDNALWARFRRHISRLSNQVGFIQEKLPRYFGYAATALFFVGVLIYSVIAGNHVRDVINTLTVPLGLSLQKVEIEGISHLSPQEIYDAIGLVEGSGIFTADTKAIKQNLEQLPFVGTADVRKIYPDKLAITIKERVPYATWQHNGQFDIVDKDGAIVSAYDAKLATGLPLVVGRGGQTNAAEIISTLSQFPALNKEVRAYIRIGARRWDLLLTNGVRLMLPEENAEARLKSVLNSPQLATIFDRDVTHIDLRLPDRITVGLTDEGLAKQKQRVAQEKIILNERKVGLL